MLFWIIMNKLEDSVFCVKTVRVNRLQKKDKTIMLNSSEICLKKIKIKFMKLINYKVTNI